MINMDDLIYIAIVILFFAASYGLVMLCDVLDENKSRGVQ